MDNGRFDLVARAVGATRSRRTAARLLAGAAFGGLAGLTTLSADAKKKKKVTLCHEGQSITVSKKGKKAHLAHGDTLGECPPPPPPATTPTTTTTAPPPGPNPRCLGPADGASYSAVRRFAQTFISQRTGLLAAAECLIKNDFATYDYTLEIRTLDSAGRPTTTVLATDTRSDFPGDSADQSLIGIFDPPASVATGVGYAFVVTTGVNQKTFTLRTRPPNTCPDQQLFIDTDATENYMPIAGDMIWSATIVV